MWLYQHNGGQYEVGYILNNQFVVVESFADQRSAELKVSFLNGGATIAPIPVGAEASERQA
jgi:hypothetical protein